MRFGITRTVFQLILVFAFSHVGRCDWVMAGANQGRTSWVAEQVPSSEYIAAHGWGMLGPVWSRPIEPFILGRVQVIAANRLLYVSTAAGLYAFSEGGELVWTYPTAMPTGHSPTISDGVAYVGCFDGRIHAINALNGEGIAVSPAAEAGFATNPLVINGVAYAGNRDGRIYAWRLGEDEWEWLFPPPEQLPLIGPILNSAAYDANDGVIYFAANDGFAYALHRTGALVWQSKKLPGEGFHSWWPVIHGDVVIYSGNHRYRGGILRRGEEDLHGLQRDFFFKKGLPRGTLSHPRVEGQWLRTSSAHRTENGTIPSISDYCEQHPDRRTYFVLDRLSGREVTYDFDHDGKPEYAPILWFGTRSGNRYPPVVGVDGVLYQSNVYLSDDWIPGGHISGWRKHTPLISTPVSRWSASDEPLAYSSGGNLIYWNLCCDRTGGAVDVTIPNRSFPREDPAREWWYYSYNLDKLIPGYDAMVDGTFILNGRPDSRGPYGGPNGVYQAHGAEQNPPIPYNGKLFFHRSNALVAFGPGDADPTPLPVVSTVTKAERQPQVSRTVLEERLAAQVKKILDAGHLRPGWGHHGNFDGAADSLCGDQLSDYWHHPADIHIALLQTIPHIPAEMQERVKEYLRHELKNYPPQKYTTIGWREGASRDGFDLPPEEDFARYAWGPRRLESDGFAGWTAAQSAGPPIPPYFFYALWKYAETMGGARALFEDSRELLPPPPDDETLAKYPFVHNAFIAGYIGYLRLEELAGWPKSTSIDSELERLLKLRASTFSENTPYQSLDPIATPEGNCRSLSVSRNFIFLVPELANYLRETALPKIETSVAEYERVAPYWFVAFSETGLGENTFSPLYDRLLFLAKAWILREPGDELVRYLDVPAFPVGDLHYIQNLVASIESYPQRSRCTAGSYERSSSRSAGRIGSGTGR